MKKRTERQRQAAARRPVGAWRSGSGSRVVIGAEVWWLSRSGVDRNGVDRSKN